MKFLASSGGSAPTSLADAVASGYPGPGAWYLPGADADLRPLVYAPQSSFAESAALAAACLLPGTLDPAAAADLAEELSAAAPLVRELDEGLLLADLARGASGSAADFSAGIVAALLPGLLPERGLALAGAEGAEAAALALAFSRPGAPRLVLVVPPEGLPRFPAELPAGRAPLLVGLPGGLAARRGLERALAAAGAGTERLRGAPLLPPVPVGPATPLRLLGRCLLFASLFTEARRGLAGDLLVAANPADGLSLATGLWAWRWGLPVSAFVRALPSGLESTSSTDESEAAARAAIERALEGLPPSAVLVDRVVGPAALDRAADFSRDREADLDRASLRALAAALDCLEEGYAGHARIVVPRFADPVWDLEAEARSAPSSAFGETAAGAASGKTLCAWAPARPGLLLSPEESPERAFGRILAALN